MSSPTVIDANCLKGFQDERVSGKEDIFTSMINKVYVKGCIAIDSENLAIQEYNDCCKPSSVGINLKDWIADEIINKKIVPFTMNREIFRELIQMGLPKPDCKWPGIAVGAGADTIITQDIDLFDPGSKSANAKTKEKIRNKGGKLSKHLKKNFKIEVTTAENFLI